MTLMPGSKATAAAAAAAVAALANSSQPLSAAAAAQNKSTEAAAVEAATSVARVEVLRQAVRNENDVKAEEARRAAELKELRRSLEAKLALPAITRGAGPLPPPQTVGAPPPSSISERLLRRVPRAAQLPLQGGGGGSSGSGSARKLDAGALATAHTRPPLPAQVGIAARLPRSMVPRPDPYNVDGVRDRWMDAPVDLALERLSPEFKYMHLDRTIDPTFIRVESAPRGSALNPIPRGEITYDPQDEPETHMGDYVGDPYRLVKLRSIGVENLRPEVQLPQQPSPGDDDESAEDDAVAFR
jgi:hypothetical protein